MSRNDYGLPFLNSANKLGKMALRFGDAYRHNLIMTKLQGHKSGKPVRSRLLWFEY